MPGLSLSWETINLLDATGKKLNIYTKSMPDLIKSLCSKSSEMYEDFKELTDSILSFLDENDLSTTDIARKTLNLYKKYFNDINTT